MSVRRSLLSLTVLAVLCLAPLAAAGTQANPETGDDSDDDVSINGGANCGLPATGAPGPLGDPCLWPASTDFEWPNIDVDWAWANDTATDLVFYAQNKDAAGFSPQDGVFGAPVPVGEAHPLTVTWTLAFTVDGVPYAAIVTMGADGVLAGSGVTGTFVVAPIGDHDVLAVTVPKDVVKAHNGSIIGALTFLSKGEDDQGNTFEDQVPNSGTAARDYSVVNGTASNATAADSNGTVPANNTGSASAGTSGSAATGSSTGPSRGPVSGSGTISHSSTGSGDGKSTGSFGTEGDKQSPAAGLLVTGLVLVALALSARRRL